MSVAVTLVRTTFQATDALSVAQFNAVVVASASVPSATTGTEGVIQLAGDLGGTATEPVIVAKAVTLAKMADLAEGTVIGRAPGDDTGVPTALPLTEIGYAVIGAEDETAAQEAIGLEIGVDVQAYSAKLATLAGLSSVANLSALAGLTGAANKLPYFTGSGAMAVTDISSTARTLLDDSSTSAMRTTLGVAIGSDVQAYHANLAALAGLSGAANKLPYFTGSGAMALTDITSTARTLLDDSSTSAMRTTLGVAIGSNVQAYHANLAALAGLTGAADRVPYFNGAGSMTLMTVTSAARGLLNDSSVSAMRTTLELKNGALKDITISSSNPSGGSDGDLWFKY